MGHAWGIQLRHPHALKSSVLRIRSVIQQVALRRCTAVCIAVQQSQILQWVAEPSTFVAQDAYTCRTAHRKRHTRTDLFIRLGSRVVRTPTESSFRAASGLAGVLQESCSRTKLHARLLTSVHIVHLHQANCSNCVNQAVFVHAWQHHHASAAAVPARMAVPSCCTLPVLLHYLRAHWGAKPHVLKVCCI